MENTGKDDKTYFNPGEFIYFYGSFVRNEEDFIICKYNIYKIFKKLEINNFNY